MQLLGKLLRLLLLHWVIDGKANFGIHRAKQAKRPAARRCYLRDKHIQNQGCAVCVWQVHRLCAVYEQHWYWYRAQPSRPTKLREDKRSLTVSNPHVTPYSAWRPRSRR
jgi:hypothetical protein